MAMKDQHALMYSSIIYDLDGTLIDSAIIVTKLLNELRAENALPALTQQDYQPWLSIGGKAMIAAALNINEEEAEQPLSIFRSRYFERPTDPATLFPDVHLTLTKLRRLSIPLGLCTNKPRALTEKVLDETGLTSFFDIVCAGNDLPTNKPHPDNMKLCLDALNSEAKQTLIVGDSSVDQQLAELSGVDFAFFTKGYDDGVNLTADTLVIEHHLDILELIQCKGEHGE